jgi:hypothetical protein
MSFVRREQRSRKDSCIRLAVRKDPQCVCALVALVVLHPHTHAIEPAVSPPSSLAEATLSSVHPVAARRNVLDLGFKADA